MIAPDYVIFYQKNASVNSFFIHKVEYGDRMEFRMVYLFKLDNVCRISIYVTEITMNGNKTVNDGNKRLTKLNIIKSKFSI